MNRPASIIIFSNGNTAVFDKAGEQIPELQVAWLDLLYEYWKSKGVDVCSVPNIETVVNGKKKYVQPIKLDDGWNTRFTDF